MHKSNITKLGIDLNVCAYCNCKLDEYSRSVDHLIPVSRKGNLGNHNKRPSCVTCNHLKGDMTVEEFVRALNSLIHFEVTNHNKRVNYLKKVKSNSSRLLETLKEEKNGRKRQ